MLDNLRDQASSSAFFQEDEPEAPAPELQRPVPRRRRKQFLGLTPAQRFIMAVMLMLTVCLLGSMLLIVTGKVWVF